MKELYFIRHGETDFNKQSEKNGTYPNIGINKKGKKQAKMTGEYLRDFQMTKKDFKSHISPHNPDTSPKDSPFDCMIVSDLLRTCMTSEYIAKEIGFDTQGENYILTDLIREHGSNYTKKHKAILDEFYEIEDPITQILAWGQYYEKKIQRDVNQESYETFSKRIEHFLKYLPTLPYKKIIIVTHGHVIRKIVSMLTRVPEEFYNTHSTLRNGNCSITYCLFKSDQYNLVTLPNTAHLKLVEERENIIKEMTKYLK
jgi:broad specificity phosphatase PhoE